MASEKWGRLNPFDERPGLAIRYEARPSIVVEYVGSTIVKGERRWLI